MEFKSLKQTLLLVSLCISLGCYSQEFALNRNHIYNSYTGINADSELFNDVTLNTHELITTNIQFSKNNDLQKVVVSPFKLGSFDSEKYNFLNNTKINLAQKNGISTFGIGFTWDNSISESKRGNRLYKTYEDKLLSTYLAKKKELDKQLTLKLNTIKVNGKKVYGEKTLNLIDEIIDELLNQGQQFFLYDRDFDKITETQTFLFYQKIRDEYDSSTKAILDQLSTKYYQALMKNSLKITGGFNISFFQLIGGDKIDLNNDDIIDNEHMIKQRTGSLSFTHIVNEKFGYSISGYLLEKRSGAEFDKNFVDYSGFSFSLAHRITTLNKDYKKTKEYLKNFFMPSFNAGISMEYLQCNDSDKSKCEKGISKNSVITPFLELKITSKNQFRIGIPINKTRQLDSTSNEVGPFIQYRLQLAGL